MGIVTALTAKSYRKFSISFKPGVGQNKYIVRYKLAAARRPLTYSTKVSNDGS